MHHAGARHLGASTIPTIGLLNTCKPPGMTSHDVVSFVRRLTGTGRVGHAGTLDPGAAGVLLVAVGQATRVLEYFEPFPKAYCGELVFGCATDSQDADGQVTQAGGGTSPERARVREALAAFVGQLQQVPPMVSAVKHRGQPLYRYARQGIEVKRQPRTVTVTRFELTEYAPGPPGVGRFLVECSSGTYVRTLCADVGARLGVPAHLGFLVRTAVGPFELSEAQTLEALAEARDCQRLHECLLPVTRGLAHLPALTLDAEGAGRVRDGVAVRPVAAPGPGADGSGPFCAFGPAGELLAVGAWDPAAGMFRPRKVLGAGDPD